MRSLALLILGACLLSNGGLFAQQRVLWFEYFPAPTVHERFASLFYRRIAKPLSITSRQSFSTFEGLVEALNDTNIVKATDTVFIATDVNTIASMARNNDSWRPFQRLRLQIAAPRIWGESIHIFAHKPVNAAGTPVKPVVFGDAFVAQAALRQLGISSGAVAAAHETGELVNAFKDPAAVVVIIDQEPSRVVTEFLARANAPLPLQMLPADREPTGIVREGGYVASLIPYDEQQFYPQFLDARRITKPTSVLVSAPTTNDVDGPLPILLMNVESTKMAAAVQKAVGGSTARAVAEAYLLSLYEYGQTRCYERAQPAGQPVHAVTEQQFREVLLNSYFADSTNAYSVLGLLGQLSFERDRDPRNLEAGYRHDVFVEMLRDKFDGRDPAAAIEWLQKNPIPERPHQGKLTLDPSLRQQFAKHLDKFKYDNAKTEVLTEQQALLKEASGTPDIAQRCERLIKVRSQLASLAALTMPVGCGKPQPTRGLWSAIDFEPFYYLAVADAIMEQSSCPAPK